VDELELRVRNHVYAAFVRDGEPPTPEETGVALGLSTPVVAETYRWLHEAHAIVLERNGEGVRMLNPFSVVPTPHRVESGGRTWFANCAWDALGIPAALDRDGVVRTECVDCGDPLELEVRDGLLVRGAELLVHFVVPARRWWDDIVFT
jgi:Alkylmercury lyase